MAARDTRPGSAPASRSDADGRAPGHVPAPADLKAAAARSGSVVDTFKAVAASFFGVRGGKAHDADMAKLNPVHVVIVGLVCAAIFIGVLILAVRFAIGTATGGAA